MPPRGGRGGRGAGGGGAYPPAAPAYGYGYDPYAGYPPYGYGAGYDMYGYPAVDPYYGATGYGAPPGGAGGAPGGGGVSYYGQPNYLLIPSVSRGGVRKVTFWGSGGKKKLWVGPKTWPFFSSTLY